jgi:predicted negative regulator of RcsB-dependent stress response
LRRVPDFPPSPCDKLSFYPLELHFVDRTTRHELKSDQFVEQVGHIVEQVEEHRSEVVRYAVAGVLAVLLVGGGYWFYQSRKTARGEALNKVIRTWTAPVGGPPGDYHFDTPEAQNKALTTAANALISKYSGSDEAGAAAFVLASQSADQGKMSEAERYYNMAAADGGAEYGSLAKLALADLAAGSNKPAEAERLYKELIAKPSALVSKDQATIQLARLYMANHRGTEAVKLLEPLRTQSSTAGRLAMTITSQIITDQRR